MQIEKSDCSVRVVGVEWGKRNCEVKVGEMQIRRELPQQREVS